MIFRKSLAALLSSKLRITIFWVRFRRRQLYGRGSFSDRTWPRGRPRVRFRVSRSVGYKNRQQ